MNPLSLPMNLQNDFEFALRLLDFRLRVTLVPWGQRLLLLLVQCFDRGDSVFMRLLCSFCGSVQGHVNDR